MAILRERAGEVLIRVGGNTQETAVLVDSLPGGVMMTKERGSTGDVVRAVCMIVIGDIMFNHFFLITSDCNSNTSLHGRSFLHDGEHLGPCKYKMVPR